MERSKRNFLRVSGMALSGSLLSRLPQAQALANAADQPPSPRTNWAGNLTFHTDNLLAPATIEATQQMVKSCARLRALGARHSFNAIADSTAAQISLAGLDSMVLDPEAKTVTVGAGVRYGTLAPYIDRQGYALHNLASLPHITVAGACSTATHGSGVHNGNLATAVSALEIVTADGQLISLSRERDADRFAGAVVGLGALGVITRTTLHVQPTFQVRQVVYQNLSISQLEHNLEDIFASGYSVSLFTDWQNHRISQVWIKSRVEPGTPFHIAPLFYGATAATRKLHPLPGRSPDPCTEQMGIPGPWYERLPHFKMNFTPSSGAELQTEYFVPRANGYQAILAVEQLRDHITPHLFISELRTIAADDLWMSPACKQDCMAIHFTWKPEWPQVRQVLPLIEQALAPFHAKPHWAKMFTMPPSAIAKAYPNLPRYRELLNHYDPQGKFRNRFIETNIFGA